MLREIAAPDGAAAEEAVAITLNLDALAADCFKGAATDLKAIAKRAARLAEKRVIDLVLSQTRWNRKQAAKRLQISYRTLRYKMKQNGLDNGVGP